MDENGKMTTGLPLLAGLFSGAIEAFTVVTYVGCSDSVDAGMQRLCYLMSVYLNLSNGDSIYAAYIGKTNVSDPPKQAPPAKTPLKLVAAT